MIAAIAYAALAVAHSGSSSMEVDLAEAATTLKSFTECDGTNPDSTTDCLIGVASYCLEGTDKNGGCVPVDGYNFGVTLYAEGKFIHPQDIVVDECDYMCGALHLVRWDETGTNECFCVDPAFKAITPLSDSLKKRVSKCNICTEPTKADSTGTVHVTVEPDSWLEVGSNTGALAGSISGVAVAALFVFFVGKE